MLQAEVPSGRSMSSMLKCIRLVPKCLRANVRKWPKSCCVLCPRYVRLVPKCNMPEAKVPNGLSMSFVLKCARLPTRQVANVAKEFVVSCVSQSLNWCQSARSRSAIFQMPSGQSMSSVLYQTGANDAKCKSGQVICCVLCPKVCKTGPKVPEAEMQYARSQSAKWPRYFFCLVPDWCKSGQRVCCVVYPKIGAKVPEAEVQYARSQSAKWPKYFFCLVPDRCKSGQRVVVSCIPKFA